MKAKDCTVKVWLYSEGMACTEKGRLVQWSEDFYSEVTTCSIKLRLVQLSEDLCGEGKAYTLGWRLLQWREKREGHREVKKY